MSPVTSSLPPEPAPPRGIQRRAWIKYQLSLRGKSAASIARDARVARQTVWKAIDSPYPKMERLIARALGVRPSVIWPERYPQQTRKTRERH